MQRFYFDHNATAPVCAEAREALLPCLDEVYGNASSIHHFGQVARQRLEQARRGVAALLGCPPAEIVFTSGGTESNNLALLGSLRPCAGKHVVTTAIEHPAVLNTCAQLEREGAAVTYVEVGAEGVVDADGIRRALRPETRLISVMHANNELGTVQPVGEIGRVAREAGVLFHSDGVQAAGRIAAADADLYAVSGHKLGALKGIGALRVRKGIPLANIQFGGHHERERRPGTENVPGAVSLGAAAAWAHEHGEAEARRLARLRDLLEQGILARVRHARVNGDPGRRLPNTTNIRFEYVEGEPMVIGLDLAGFAVSSGAACSSGAVEPSHVLIAIGLAPRDARSALRFSLGRGNDEGQVVALIDAVCQVASHLRRVSAEAPAHV